MARKSMMFYIAVVLLVVGAWAAPAITQAPTQESALLTEVRLLREAIEALAGNGSRIQLVFGRLQLQEQRTTAAVTRVNAARAALSSHMVSMAALNNRTAELESSATNTTPPPEDARAIQDMLAHYKREYVRLEAERVRLAAEEADATQALSLEQGRWSDLNRQVEELERALMRAR